jgi:hypothetical protein
MTTKQKTETAVVGDALGAGAGEPAPWEEQTVNPAGDQEMEVFAAPVESQWRRPLKEHELLAWIAAQANMGEGDDLATGLSMMAEVAAAATLEESISGQVETTKSREILDTLIECHGIKFIKSTEKDGCPYFAICDVRISNTGERDTLNIGGWRAVGQLGRMHYQSMELTEDSPFLVAPGTAGAWAKESFPHYFKVKQKPTSSGHMNYLAPAMS